MENADIFFSTEMWFAAKDVAEITTSADGAYVRLFSGEEYTIKYTMFKGNKELAVVTRVRGNSTYIAYLDKLSVLQQLALAARFKSAPPPSPSPAETTSIVTIRMAFAGTDENMNKVLYPVELNLEYMTSTWNSPGLTHVRFRNGAWMTYGGNQITYTGPDGNPVYAEWATPNDLFNATMYFIERGDWEGVQT